MEYSRLTLLQEAFHGFDLLEVTGHVSGQHHLYHQSPQFSETVNGKVNVQVIKKFMNLKIHLLDWRGQGK